MVKLGLCCAGGASCLLVCTALMFGNVEIVKETVEDVAQEVDCIKPSAGGSDVELSGDEKSVVIYFADLIESGTLATASEEVLERDLGLTHEAVAALDQGKLRTGVFAELARRGFDVASLSLGNCSKYSACSVERNLNNATGDELARYEKEVAQDGSTFQGWSAPDFELPTTSGEKVSLSDFRGKNVALVFLSGHCYHSLDTLPILGELRAKYSDVEFLPVFINSGDVQDVITRAYELDVEYAIVVSADKAIAKAYDSRMVPSTFLIDEQGHVTKKLVGFKDKNTLDAAIAELIRL
jgi:peroxiredoxin